MTTSEMAGSHATRTAEFQAALPSYTRPLAIVTTLFFMWGFLTSLNDVLIPHLKSIFDLSYARAMLVQFAFFSAYFLFSIPWSRIVRRIGYQPAMVSGLVTMAVGAVLFVPAASFASPSLFLTALLVLAAGITGLQVAANPYVVVLGRPETASSRLDFAQAFNSLGTTVAPLLGGLLFLGAAALDAEALQALSPSALQLYRVEQAASVKLPYLVMAGMLALLAYLIAMSKLPKIANPPAVAGAQGVDTVWRHPNLMFGALGIFAYVGAEVSIGSFLVSYLSRPEIGALSVQSAAFYVSFYWSGAMIGRFVGAPLLQKIRAGRLLAVCAVCAASLVGVSMGTSGQVAMWTILAVGLFNSIMFPSIFSLGLAELGSLTETGSGILNMAIVGGAVVPVIQGALADRVGIQIAFLVPVLCYLYILFYGLSGSRSNSERNSPS